jgi:hypothetical protein
MDNLQRSLVTMEMSRLYGEAFAKDFLGFTRSGTRIEQLHYGPKIPEHTPKWFAERGYELAQRDDLNDWRVHPNGHEITQDRGIPWGKNAPPDGPVVEPPKCDPGDAKQLLDMTLESIHDDIAENQQRQTEAIAQKEAMDRMNVVSDEFRDAYDAYVSLMDEGKRRVHEQLDEIAAARTSLLEMCADVKKVDDGRDEIEELQNSFDVNRDLRDMEGRKPIRAKFK